MNGLAEQLKSLFVTVIYAVLIIVFVAQSFVVDGRSMEPTLHDGQRLLVEKISYHITQPKAGEIIVLRNPANPRQRFIKRVVAVPGDLVEMKDRTLFVNERPVPEEYIAEGALDRFYPQLVPEGHVFVLGDNRNHSLDSRRIGMIPYDNIIGRVILRFWPLHRLAYFTRPRV